MVGVLKDRCDRKDLKRKEFCNLLCAGTVSSFTWLTYHDGELELDFSIA